jgi:hypothetical protein
VAVGAGVEVATTVSAVALCVAVSAVVGFIIWVAAGVEVDVAVVKRLQLNRIKTEPINRMRLRVFMWVSWQLFRLFNMGYELLFGFPHFL